MVREHDGRRAKLLLGRCLCFVLLMLLAGDRDYNQAANLED